MHSMPSILAPLALMLVSAPLASEIEWSQFRGNSGQGLSSQRDLPLAWSEEENVVWKIPVPGQGWSSPVVDDDQVWTTYALPDENQLRALCLSRETGAVIHDVLVFEPDELVPLHDRNGHATPTPALDAEHVYAHFGTYGTAAIERASGEILWTNRELTLEHQWGPGSSPTLSGGRLFVNCDGMGDRYVAAIDSSNGKTLWRTDRTVPTQDNGFFRKAFSTPLLIESKGRELLISSGANQVSAYDPATGSEEWFVRFDGYAGVAAPSFAHGIVFATTGYGEQSILAVKADGEGDVTQSHVLWKTKRGAPIIPSQVAVWDELYMVDDAGILSCVDSRTGEEHWRERLGGGAVSASITYANRHLYVHDDQGTTFVVDPTIDGLEIVAENPLDAPIQASLAVAGDSLFLRTATHLYRLAEED